MRLGVNACEHKPFIKLVQVVLYLTCNSRERPAHNFREVATDVLLTRHDSNRHRYVEVTDRTICMCEMSTTFKLSFDGGHIWRNHRCCRVVWRVVVWHKVATVTKQKCRCEPRSSCPRCDACSTDRQTFGTNDLRRYNVCGVWRNTV